MSCYEIGIIIRSPGTSELDSNGRGYFMTEPQMTHGTHKRGKKEHQVNDNEAWSDAKLG